MKYSNLDWALTTVGNKLAMDPMDWEAWSAKADLLCAAGMYETAIRCCDKALTFNPEDSFAWITKGNALSKLGEQDGADLCYKRARELEPLICVYMQARIAKQTSSSGERERASL